MLGNVIGVVGLVLAVLGVLTAVIIYKRQEKSSDAAQREQIGKLEQQRTDLENERRRHAPIQVMPPEHTHREYVNRPQPLREILGKLFLDQARVIVLGGDLGVGKTWLAKELGRITGTTQEQQGRISPFRDGLLWCSLGPHPEPKDELKTWLMAADPDLKDPYELRDEKPQIALRIAG